MTARGTDWGLAALVALLIVTGALTLFAGGSGDAWVFVAHDGAGFAIVLLLVFKLRRVWPRLRRPERWDRRTLAGVLGTGLVVAALGSGLMWADGVTPRPAAYSLLAWHDVLGVVLAAAIVCHMVFRAKPMRTRDVVHRRQFLTGVVIGAGGFLAARGATTGRAAPRPSGRAPPVHGVIRGGLVRWQRISVDVVGGRQPPADRAR